MFNFSIKSFRVEEFLNLLLNKLFDHLVGIDIKIVE